MLNTIRLKILAVALALLTVFATTTGLSTFLLEQVVEEMDAITVYHIPIGVHVSSLDVLTFEIELALRRALAKAPLEASSLAALRTRHAEITNTLRNDFKLIHNKLAAGVADSRNDVQDRIALAGLQGSFTFIEHRLTPFIKTSDEVLAAIESGDVDRANTAMVNFAQYDAVFSTEFASVRKAIESLDISYASQVTALSNGVPD